jgi:hypothetical protein
MQPRTAFRLAMLANGFQPLLNDCKRAIELGWPRKIVDAAEVLTWDRSALTSTRHEDRRRLGRDRCRRERRGAGRDLGGHH